MADRNKRRLADDFTIVLSDEESDNDEEEKVTAYFYENSVADKLKILQRLKGIAGEYFKCGDQEKAAKIYQKINSKFNFGDVANNFLQEDENTEEFKQST